MFAPSRSHPTLAPRPQIWLMKFTGFCAVAGEGELNRGEGIWGQKLMSSTYSRMTGNRRYDLTCPYVIVKWRNRHFKIDFINIADDNIIIPSICLKSRACLKNAFCKMCVTICGRFRLNEGGVAGYVNWMKAKYTANWGVQIAGMIFQTRSSQSTAH